MFLINKLMSELARLVDTINGGIATRGVYLLMDDRLDLIYGPGALQKIDEPDVIQKIAEFSAAHGWSVAPCQRGFVFSALASEIDFSNF